MRERLLDIFNSFNYQPKTFDELAEILEIKEADEVESLQIELDKLLGEYEIFLNRKKNRYILPRDANIFKGRIEIAKAGYGFIVSDYFENDLFVAINNLENAHNKDKVLFTTQMYKSKSQTEAKLEGIVLEVLSRHLTHLIGTIHINGEKVYLSSNEVDKKVKVRNPEGLKENMVVKAKIVDYLPDIYFVEVIDILGNSDDVGMDISIIAARYDFPTQFPEEVIQEANQFSDDISEEAKRRRRVNRTIITIDGDDAKDLDDAVSIEKLENGNYLLGVYIADVSYYVTKGSYLDQEAYERGTSVYLTDRVIPMLPKRLSNNLCSLNPNEDKLIIACEMEIDKNGQVVDSDIFEGVIQTKYRMTYNNVNKMIAGESEVIEKYREIYQDVIAMTELSKILETMRHDRGALDFDIPESKIIVDETGKAIDVVLRARGVSERIIESFMLIANETIATTITHLDLPFVYRVHDKPNTDKLTVFQNVAKSLGYTLKNKANKINQTSIQTLLENIKEEDVVLNTLILRMMAKAIYSEKNIGHYGLASTHYTHFTSPIRRYPDLLVHRLLRKYLFNGDINPEEFTYLIEYIKEAAANSSRKERDAIDCEYEVNDMKKAEYMEQFIGEEFDGVISSVTSFGMFIELPNTIDGLVRTKDLVGDSFEYDSRLMCIRGLRSNKVFRIGEKVKVKLVNADKKKREIDFKLVYNIDDLKSEGKAEKKSRKEFKTYRNEKPKSFTKGKPGRGHYGEQKRRSKKQKGKS